MFTVLRRKYGLVRLNNNRKREKESAGKHRASGRERERGGKSEESNDHDVSLSLHTLEMFTYDENCPPLPNLQR
jgi:hypothetical protein